MIRSVTVCALALLCIPSDARAQICTAGPVTVQILGSGGPRTNGERASASYLLWMDGRARMQVDAGGGAYLRFGQAQAQLSDLWLLAVSHLHPDHVSDLPALLWLSDQTRQEPLPVAGPSGNDAMPAFPAFLSRLFDPTGGAFQILGGTMGGPPPRAPGRPGHATARESDKQKREAGPASLRHDPASRAGGLAMRNARALASFWAASSSESSPALVSS